MVRFSDLLGRNEDDDEPLRASTPTEPLPPPPTEPPPPAPPTSIGPTPTTEEDLEVRAFVDALRPVDDDLLPSRKKH
jgi:hypothetical protein